jgi:hypothetical protein
MPLESPLRPLLVHPGSPCPAALSLRAGASAGASAWLDLTFVLSGPLDRLRIPPRTPMPTKIDRLWEHTCFEAFLARDAGNSYLEINLSPSGNWAAYAFDGYRERALRDPDVRPEVRLESDSAALTLTARLRLPAGWCAPGTGLRVGLCAVVEAIDGSLSYWALRHAAERPDFHHPDGFALVLDRGLRLSAGSAA